jgi:hypothetical protein
VSILQKLLSIFFITLSVAMVAACVWQIQRGQAKMVLAEAAQNQTPTQLCVHRKEFTSNTLVTTTLHLSPKQYFLLDNQVHHRQLGHTLIGLHFDPTCQTWFGVDLGWVSNNETAEIRLQHYQGVSIEAILTQPKGFLWTSHPPNKVEQWPKHLSYLDTQIFLEWAPKPTSSHLLLSPESRLYQAAKNGQKLSLQAMRHYGYALQFAFFACYHIQTDRSSHAQK